MSTTATTTARPVLADLLGARRSLLRDAALVIGAALLTAAAAQLVVPLPFSPVPLTGQTFAVLLAAAALGPVRAVASMALYLTLGAVGLPFYSEASGGVSHLVGATGGYLVGFLLAALVVGALARRGMDRAPHRAGLALLAGQATIYAVGVPWLALHAGVGASEALSMGLWPFLVGDAVKIVAAGLLLPGAWLLAGRDR